MTFSPHVRMTMSGVVDNTPEIFTYNVNLSGLLDAQNTGLGDPSSGIWDTLAAAAVAFHGRAQSKVSGAARLKSVKFAAIGPDGKYRDTPISRVTNQLGGGAAALVYPTQVSLAVSVTTSAFPPSRGRFYLPCPTTPLDAGGLISETDRGAVTGSAKTFLDALNTAIRADAPADGVVVSSSKGYLTKATGVRVGRRLDILRSRGNSNLEVHVTPTALA